MITSEQLKLYGRRWGATCVANGWRTTAGQLACDEAASAARSDLHRQVWEIGRELAGAGQLGLDDLRRAVTALAAGRFVSTKGLTNQEFSRLLCLIGSGPRYRRPEKRDLLIDPDDLVSMRYWLDPELEEVEQWTWFIEHECEPAYVKRIAADRFGVADWRGLARRDLRQLWLTLHNRPKARR